MVLRKRARYVPPRASLQNYPDAVEIFNQPFMPFARNPLIKGGFKTLDQICAASLYDLLDVRGFGIKSLESITRTMNVWCGRRMERHIQAWFDGELEQPWHLLPGEAEEREARFERYRRGDFSHDD